jgi:hypothetical protein
MESIDVPQWNKRVESAFVEAKSQVPKYSKELQTIIDVLSKTLNIEERLLLEKRAGELREIIDDLLNDTSFGFYLLEVQKLMDEFSKQIKPVSIPFMKKDRPKNQKSNEIAMSFLRLIEKYNQILNLELPQITNAKKTNPMCLCGNSKEFDIIDNRVYYCLKCGVQLKENLNSRSTYRDVDRSNCLSKYKYTRMIHMRNCVRQYQGKQKVRIPPTCLKGVMAQLELNGNYHDINPQHIRNALQETGWSDQYENFVLIWSLITHRNCPDISQLEDFVYRDFECIEKEYNIVVDTPREERSSFMSYPYVLYQILKRHRINCDLTFFNMLKSDRIDWLDDTMETIYRNLEWNGFKRLGV